MNKSDLPFLSVVELSRLLKCQEISPVELTEAYLDRVDRFDSKLNAYITVVPEMAMEQARKAEAQIRVVAILDRFTGSPWR